MKLKLVISLMAVFLFSAGVSAQDLGAPDSVTFVIQQPVAGVADQVVTAQLYVFNDVQTITGASAAFSWDNTKLVMESVTWSPGADSVFDFMKLAYYGNSLALTNSEHKFQMAVGRMFKSGLLPYSSPQLILTYNFRATGWTATDTARFHLEDFNALEFVDENTNPYIPIWTGDAVIAGVTSIGGADLPVTYDLAQNYPNPFNPVTKITFDLPERAKTTLSVFNVLGQKVTTLVDAELAADRYEVEWDGSHVASGIYFYRLDTDKFVMTKKMMLLK
ncbi:MAG: T9SS type A sorting domain-containing protein [candidate division Zixibacteria bacterium]|nr:T9SS type A sorting domain-containing protein [candidate division Zixibacteria bacterium]